MEQAKETKKTWTLLKKKAKKLTEDIGKIEDGCTCSHEEQHADELKAMHDSAGDMMKQLKELKKNIGEMKGWSVKCHSKAADKAAKAADKAASSKDVDGSTD